MLYDTANSTTPENCHFGIVSIGTRAGFFLQWAVSRCLYASQFALQTHNDTAYKNVILIPSPVSLHAIKDSNSILLL